jgi:glycosyltransferase involved in cell wall biosynthesis
MAFKKDLPSISILIPTLNAASVLGRCLKAISAQNYPQNRLEIIISDGGSTDKTLALAKKYHAKVYPNLLKTAEAGKAVALRHAQGKLIALIDSDNILPNKGWLKKMVKPFSDPEILGSEPWEFTYRKEDSLISRYCSLIGANDPYCYFVGNYDKKSVLSGRWTGLNVKQKDRGDYLKVRLEGGLLPTIGANGTIWRRGALKKAVGKSDYLFDTDIPYILSAKKPFYFAKVKVGIIHLYCRTVSDFVRKQKRRIKDFFYLESKKARPPTYQRQKSGQLYFAFATLSLLPLIFQTLWGYLRKPDKAWFFHPLACWLTLWIYTKETVLSKFKITEMDRKSWRQ